MNACFTDYIGTDRTSTSRSGLFATDLPGIVLATLQELTTEDQADYLEFWDVVYGRAVSNLVSDVSTLLQKKFHVNAKLLTRETSDFTEVTNSGSNYPGILIEFDLPKYGLLHIISVDMYLDDGQQGLGATINIYDGVDSITELGARSIVLGAGGLNSFGIDIDFSYNSIFVSYNFNEIVANKTENKVFNSNLVNDKLSCESCYGDGHYTGTITQVNGGGLNVHYVIYCSIEKFVCENLNLFKKALWWKVGAEIAVEQIFGERINRFTTMSAEGADKRMSFFNTQYQIELIEAIKSQNIPEDVVCFRCKNIVESTYSTP